MPPAKDHGDALAALERLARHQVIAPEQAQAAARLITGDADLVFPPPAAPPAPAAPAPPPAEEASEEAPPADADKTPSPGSETP